MANIGQELTEAEIGWQRYLYSNNLLTYVGNWVEQPGYFRFSFDKSNKLRFNFTGIKIRIIGSSYADNRCTENGHIYIDGKIIGNINEKLAVSYNNILVYEIVNLWNGEHFAELYSDDNDQFRFSALDIDKNGELKPYNSTITIINNKFLLKQNNQYYSIKPEFYDASKDIYNPQLITDMDSSSFNNYGIDDISSIHYNALNKLIENKYNIAMMK